MKAFLAFLLIPLSFLAYIALAGQGIFQRYAIPHFVVAGLGLLLLAWLLRKQFTWPRLVWNVLGWIMIGFISWWIFSYSNYPEAPGEMDKGKVVAIEGVDLNEAQATLLVFYRGHW